MDNPKAIIYIDYIKEYLFEDDHQRRRNLGPFAGFFLVKAHPDFDDIVTESKKILDQPSSPTFEKDFYLHGFVWKSIYLNMPDLIIDYSIVKNRRQLAIFLIEQIREFFVKNPHKIKPLAPELTNPFAIKPIFNNIKYYLFDDRRVDIRPYGGFLLIQAHSQFNHINA